MDYFNSAMAKTVGFYDHMSPTTEIIAEARKGRMFILINDENRENEGDIVMPAQFTTPDAINFMAKHARGLICLALSKRRCDYLGLKPMSEENGSRLETAFTVSIEAREGVTTGISAADRARTIAIALNEEFGHEDIVTPGHVFPLVAREGGVLVHAGRTEAAVDIARLAGVIPAGVICQIMNDDGSMAKLPDLIEFSQRHNLKLGTIADLIAYRRHTEKLVTRVEEGVINYEDGTSWRMISYKSLINNVEHLALTKGDLTGPDPVLVCIHAIDTISEILIGSHVDDLRSAMEQIKAVERGAVVVIRETRPNALSERVRDLVNNRQSEPAPSDYGIGAQILRDMGVSDMVLLSNYQHPTIGLDGYGLNVVERKNTKGLLINN